MCLFTMAKPRTSCLCGRKEDSAARSCCYCLRYSLRILKHMQVQIHTCTHACTHVRMHAIHFAFLSLFFFFTYHFALSTAPVFELHVAWGHSSDRLKPSYLRTNEASCFNFIVIRTVFSFLLFFCFIRLRYFFLNSYSDSELLLSSFFSLYFILLFFLDGTCFSFASGSDGFSWGGLEWQER